MAEIDQKGSLNYKANYKQPKTHIMIIGEVGVVKLPTFSINSKRLIVRLQDFGSNYRIELKLARVEIHERFSL